jgi:TatA/E family protein of Tat protein translocase
LNFLGMGPMELVVIMVLALVVFGPGKLPEIAGQVGRMVRDFKRATGDMSSEFTKAFSLEADQPQTANVAPTQPAPPVDTQPAGPPALPAPIDEWSVSDTSTASVSVHTTGTLKPPARGDDLAPPY